MKDQLYEISGKFLGGRKEKEHSMRARICV